MASIDYFLLSLCVFLCLSCSSAKRVLLDPHVGDQDLPLNIPVDDNDNDNHSPITETGYRFGFGSGVGVGHGAGESTVGVGVGGSIGIGGGGYGVGVGSGSGFGPGGWTGPVFGGGPGPGNGCTLGYVCPSNLRGGCNNFPYGSCQSYNFFPLNPMEHHEVEINWAVNKPVTKIAQYDEDDAGQPRPPPRVPMVQNGV